MTHTILETVHGSHLYGLNNSNSDRDFFRVVSGNSNTRHTITGDIDITQMSIDRFLTNVFKGSHQSCEALFSPLAGIDPQYRPMFEAIRVTGSDVFARYRRTIRAFSFGDAKKRRHAVRLGFNLSDLVRSGRFNPVLTDNQRMKVSALSKLYSGETLYNIAITL
jgi:hypothetical protein